MATVAVQAGAPNRREAVFASVFPPHDHTIPTPEATPNIGTLTSPGAPFGGFNTPNDHVNEALNANRAWSLVTRELSIPLGLQTGKTIRRDQITGFRDALSFVLSRPAARNDLHKWYLDEIRAHLQQYVLPELQFWHKPVAIETGATVLSTTVKVLQKAQHLYMNHLEQLDSGHSSDAVASFKGFCSRVKQSLHLLVLYSLPRDRIQKTLASYLFHSMKSSLEESPTIIQCLSSGKCFCRVHLDLQALSELRDVGLGDAIGERALALATHRLLAGPALQRRCFEVDWSSRESVSTCLTQWIETIFVPTIEKAVSALTFSNAESLSTQIRTIAVNRLGLLRISSLFDYVKSWPHSQGAVLDIREYLAVNGAPEKVQLCASFSEQANRRLLHAGASTVEILSIYVNVIHVFKLLDSRGVLFEKVSIPIRHYLRSRDDTATIIAASFLADTEENGEVMSQDLDKICPDIAIEIATSTLESEDDRSLRWDDMEWLPDPIDAGPDYKFTKADDILAHVLGLFEQEEFIKELLNFLGQHFLRSSDLEFAKETRLIELLKARLDPAKLQAAEVMLKDMRDSKLIGRRINPRPQQVQPTHPPTPREIQAAIPPEGMTLAALYSLFETRIKRAQFVAAIRLVANRRNDLYFPKRSRQPAERAPEPAVTGGLEFGAKVLSGFFWPALRADSFNLPQPVREQMDKFDKGFSGLSGQRRLEWRPALCIMHVELELEDRKVDEKNVPAWRASVIDAFASHSSGAELMADLSIPDLCEMLAMDEDLASDAINFWLGKRVLYQTAPGRFAVLERLDMQIDDVEASEQQLNESISAVRTQDAMLREGAPMFEMFIKNMLQNSGPKEIGGMMGITGMLRMVLPTFTFGDEGVAWLLSQMEGRGEVQRNGETWAVST